MLNKVTDRLRSDEAGFTLIELLVVITILGILAAVVVFSVGGIGDKGQDSACATDLTTIQTAQEAYAAQPSLGNGKYAASAAALTSANLLSNPPKLHTTKSVSPFTSYTISRAAASPCGTDSVYPSP